MSNSGRVLGLAVGLAMSRSTLKPITNQSRPRDVTGRTKNNRTV